MSDLKAYLAAKYMSGPKADAILAQAGKKKRKRPKNEDYVGGEASKDTGGGLVLQDEDVWRGSRSKAAVDLDGEDAPVVGKDVSTFKKAKQAWATVGATSLPVASRVKEEPRDGDDDAGGSGSGTRDGSAEAGPSTVKAEPDAPKVQLTKRRGGLRTAAQMAEQAERAAAERVPSPPAEAPTETVHRDQSGRIVDINQLREQARREEEEERRMEAERKEWSKGFVQRGAREDRLAQERAMATQDVARHADDEAMNRELKEVERWDDPAAKFLTKKAGKKGKSRWPVYKGAYAQNRFGIAPGYRWDGVDRSTGFEKKWLQAQNAMARRSYEAEKWSMEDM